MHFSRVLLGSHLWMPTMLTKKYSMTCWSLIGACGTICEICLLLKYFKLSYSCFRQNFFYWLERCTPKQYTAAIFQGNQMSIWDYVSISAKVFLIHQGHWWQHTCQMYISLSDKYHLVLKLTHTKSSKPIKVEAIVVCQQCCIFSCPSSSIPTLVTDWLTVLIQLQNLDQTIGPEFSFRILK